jgi:hypothetical protein
MAEGTIDVTAKKGEVSVTVPYDFGADLDDMANKFGKEVTFSNARAQMKISLQALIRRGIEAGEDEKAIQANAKAWIPGVQSERKSDPISLITAKWGQLDPAAKAEMLKKLKAMA